MLRLFAARASTGKTTTRVLGANENVWQAQCRWRNTGRFVLENRKETVRSTLEKVRAFISQLEEAKQNIALPSTVWHQCPFSLVNEFYMLCHNILSMENVFYILLLVLYLLRMMCIYLHLSFSQVLFFTFLWVMIGTIFPWVWFCLVCEISSHACMIPIAFSIFKLRYISTKSSVVFVCRLHDILFLLLVFLLCFHILLWVLWNQ